jgi:hypothetical protein
MLLINFKVQENNIYDKSDLLLPLKMHSVRSFGPNTNITI